EVPRAAIRALVGERRYDDAWQLLRPLLLGGDDPGAWDVARNLLKGRAAAGWTPPAVRQIRLGVLCGYEGAELVAKLELACRARPPAEREARRRGGELRPARRLRAARVPDRQAELVRAANVACDASALLLCGAAAARPRDGGRAGG